MSYSAIHTKLVDILETIKTAPGSLLPLYFAHEEPTSSDLITAWPYAQIIVKSSEERPLDTISNTGAYTFIVRVSSYHENRDVLETTMLTLADQIMGEVRKEINETLDGVATKFFTFNIAWGFESGNGTAPIRYFDLEIMVETIHDI